MKSKAGAKPAPQRGPDLEYGVQGMMFNFGLEILWSIDGNCSYAVKQYMIDVGDLIYVDVKGGWIGGLLQPPPRPKFPSEVRYR